MLFNPMWICTPIYQQQNIITEVRTSPSHLHFLIQRDRAGKNLGHAIFPVYGNDIPLIKTGVEAIGYEYSFLYRHFHVNYRAYSPAPGRGMITA